MKGKKKKRARSKKLSILMGAALALPGILPQTAKAQDIVPQPILRLRYGEYHDLQSTGTRMQVHAPMLMLQTPITESIDLQATGMWESMSGASPLYLSALSGASGIGIDDHRLSGDFKATKYFERYSIAAGGSASNENDYWSSGFTTEGRYWTSDKNTVFAVGAGADFDRIGSSNDPALKQSRRTGNYLAGVTQILDPVSKVQFNFTYSSADGYLSDPYKTFDTRPRSRDMYAWLVRYVRYVEETEGSVHADLRMFTDSFGVLSETAELAYYQPFGDGWMIRPNIRYYSQDAADFFQGGRFPGDSPQGFFTADQRLSSFGEIGAGLKLSKEIGEKLTADINAEAFHQRSGLHLDGIGNQTIEPFTGYFFMVGITKLF